MRGQRRLDDRVRRRRAVFVALTAHCAQRAPRQQLLRRARKIVTVRRRAAVVERDATERTADVAAAAVGRLLLLAVRLQLERARVM